MDINKLNTPIEIQTVSVKENDKGGEKETWTVFKAPVWSNFVYLSGKEYLEAKKISNSLEVRVETRLDEDIKPSMRINYKKIYNIKSVIPVSDEEMHLMCEVIE